MKVRFQADNDLDYRLVRATRQKDRTIDFRSALEAQLHGKEDTAVLKIAAEDGRIVVSHDRKTAAEFRGLHSKPILPGVNYRFEKTLDLRFGRLAPFSVVGE